MQIDPDILDFIQTSHWRFAKTMPEHPHEYIVRSWQPDHDAVFMRLVMLIHDQGYDGQFYIATYRYLDIDGWKYWTMDQILAETTLINRAKVAAPSG